MSSAKQPDTDKHGALNVISHEMSFGFKESLSLKVTIFKDDSLSLRDIVTASSPKV